MKKVNNESNPLFIEVPKPIKDMAEDELYAFADKILDTLVEQDMNPLSESRRNLE